MLCTEKGSDGWVKRGYSVVGLCRQCVGWKQTVYNDVSRVGLRCEDASDRPKCSVGVTRFHQKTLTLILECNDV